MCPEESSARKIFACEPITETKRVSKKEIHFSIESKLKACIVETDAMDHEVSVMRMDEGSVEFSSDVPFSPGSTFEIRIPTISRLANIRSPIVCKATCTTEVDKKSYRVKASFTGLSENTLGKLKEAAEKPDELKDNDGFWRGY